MAGFTIVWLHRDTKRRRSATCSDEPAAKEFARQKMADGHTDVRYKRPGERNSRAVRLRKTKTEPKPTDIRFPPTAASLKAARLSEKKGSDLLDRRLPGSIGTGKRR
jgi:hypothetical protein